jgi:hypothetical protein
LNASNRSITISKPAARIGRQRQIAQADQRDLVEQLHLFRRHCRGEVRYRGRIVSLLDTHRLRHGDLVQRGKQRIQHLTEIYGLFRERGTVREHRIGVAVEQRAQHRFDVVAADAAEHVEHVALVHVTAAV